MEGSIDKKLAEVIVYYLLGLKELIPCDETVCHTTINLTETSYINSDDKQIVQLAVQYAGTQPEYKTFDEQQTAMMAYTPPVFGKGMQSWKNNMDRLEQQNDLISECLRVGEKQTAIIYFDINVNGDIQNVRLENPLEVHPRLAAEAMRVIETSSKWHPAVQGGKPVYSHFVQRITWSYVEYKAQKEF